jgi:hypothetical protein
MSLSTRETVLLNYIEYLLDYARRVAQRQITQGDVARLTAIRATVKELNLEEAKGNANL